MPAICEVCYRAIEKKHQEARARGEFTSWDQSNLYTVGSDLPRCSMPNHLKNLDASRRATALRREVMEWAQVKSQSGRLGYPIPRGFLGLVELLEEANRE